MSVPQIKIYFHKKNTTDKRYNSVIYYQKLKIKMCILLDCILYNINIKY